MATANWSTYKHNGEGTLPVLRCVLSLVAASAVYPHNAPQLLQPTVDILGLSTQALKPDSLDLDSMWSRVSSTQCADYAHCTAGLDLTHWPGAL